MTLETRKSNGDDVMDNGDVRRPAGTGEALAEALSNLKLAQQRDGNQSSDNDTSTHVETESGLEGNVATESLDRHPCPIDPVLVDAMRNARDKAFILEQEKEMEVRIRDDEITYWELPPTNSYLRLLTHRIADHFRLGHSLDLATMKVTLTKQSETRIPDQYISTLASNERLSEPASNGFPSLLSSLSGQSTPSSVNASSGTPKGVRIMRRPGASRSDSPRNGSATPDDVGANGARKDRRNKTMEEREADYKEARLRIFGGSDGVPSGDPAPPPPSSTDGSDAPPSEGQTNRKLSEPRAGTPASGISEDARNANRSDGTASNPDVHQAAQIYMPSMANGPYDPYSLHLRPSYGMYAYQGMDSHQQQQSPYFVPPPGQWANVPLSYQTPPPLDANGRPMMAPNWPTYATYSPYVGGNGYGVQAGYVEHSHSPSASSRSTSLSAGTEGGLDSRNSSISEQNGNVGQTHFYAAPHTTTSMGTLPPAPVSRSHSVSPSVPYHPRQTPPSSGNATPGSIMMNGAPPGATHVLPAYHYSPSPSGMNEYGGTMRNGAMTSRIPASPNGPMQSPINYFPVSQFGSSSTSGSASPMRSDDNGVRRNTMSGMGRGRGRLSQGSDRSLYDPNKPTSSPSPMSSTSGTSVTGGHGATRTPSLPQLSTQVRSPSSAGGSQQTNRSTSSSSSSYFSRQNPDPSTSSSATSSSSSSVARQTHHSLPPRPDWVIKAGRSTSGNSVHELQEEVALSANNTPKLAAKGDTDDLLRFSTTVQDGETALSAPATNVVPSDAQSASAPAAT